MKTYSSLTAFAKNRNTPRVQETWSEFYGGHYEDCKIYGMYCIAYVVFYDKEGNVMKPHNSGMPKKVEYHFRFDPITDKQYQKYKKLCAQYDDPEWITLS